MNRSGQNETGILVDSRCGNNREVIIVEGETPNLSHSAFAIASKSRVRVESQ